MQYMTLCNASVYDITVSNQEVFPSSLLQPYLEICWVFVRIFNPFHLKDLIPRLIFNFHFAEPLLPSQCMCLYIFCYLSTVGICQDENSDNSFLQHSKVDSEVLLHHLACSLLCSIFFSSCLIAPATAGYSQSLGLYLTHFCVLKQEGWPVL